MQIPGAIFLLSLFAHLAVAQSQWNIREVDSSGDVGDLPAIAIDPQGQPHLADSDFSRRTLRHHRWNGVSWQSEAVDGKRVTNEFGSFAAKAGDLDFAIDADGTLHLAYLTRAPGGEAERLRFAWREPGEAEWNRVTLRDLGDHGSASVVKLALDPAGHPHLITRNDENSELTHWERDEFQQWHPQALFEGEFPRQNSLQAFAFAIDSQSTLHLVLNKEDGAPERYATRPAGQPWQIQNLVATNGSIRISRSFDLFIDSEDDLHLVYEGVGGIEHARSVPGGWQREVVVDPRPNEGFFRGTERVQDLAIAIDQQSRPHVLVSRGRRDSLCCLGHWVREAEGWSGGGIFRQSATGVGFPDDELGERTPRIDLAVDPGGRLHLAFDTGRPFTNLLYGALTDSPWTIVDAQAGASPERFEKPSLVIDSMGSPHLAYQYKLNNVGAPLELRYARHHSATGAWERETAATGDQGDRGLDPSLAISPESGTPAVTFYSPEFGAFEYGERQDGTWVSELLWPPDPQANPAAGGKSHLLFNRESPGPQVLFAHNGILHYARKPNAPWNVFPDSAQSGTILDVFNAPESRYPAHQYVLYLHEQFDLKLAIWDGTTWHRDESISTGTIADGLIGPASVAWDYQNQAPVVTFARRRFVGGGMPISYARRASGSAAPSTWEVFPVLDPGYPITALQLATATGRQLIAFTGFLRPINVLSRAAETDPWIAETVAGESSEGAGLSVEIAAGNDWIAYSAPSALRIAFRSSEGSLNELSGVVEYGTRRPVLGWNALTPCEDHQDDKARRPKSAPPRRAPTKSNVTLDPNERNPLTILRALRDTIQDTAEGRRLINLYYEHRKEIRSVGLTKPSLVFETLHTMRNFFPGVVALVNGRGDDLHVTPDLVAQARNVLAPLAEFGSPELKTTIARELERYNNLDLFLGQTFAAAAQQIGLLEAPPSLRVRRTERVGRRFTLEVDLIDGLTYSLWRSATLRPASWVELPSAEVVIRVDHVCLSDPLIPAGRWFYQARATNP